MEFARVVVMEGVLGRLMRVGRRGCVTYDDGVGERWCFVELLRFMVEQGMVDFTGVSRERLDGAIRELPVEVQLMAAYLLAEAKGSPLPRA